MMKSNNIHSKTWSNKEIDLLRRNYPHTNIYELSQLLHRGVWGIKQKLERLVEKEPESWNAERVNEFNANLYRDLSSGKYDEIKQSKQIGGFHRWSDDDDKKLKENYKTKKLEELVFLLGRKEGAIAQRLYCIFKKQPEKFDKEAAFCLIRCFAAKYRRSKGKKERPIWTDEQLELLKENYEKKALYELAKLVGHGVWGTIQKLERLYWKDPEVWNEKRMKELYAELYRSYRNSHPEQKEGSKMHHEMSVVRNFLEREKAWTNLDTCVLYTSYLIRDYSELAEIFRFKYSDVIKKLKSMYKQEPYGWDIERINELEEQASKTDSETLKGFEEYFIIKKIKPNIERRAKIDKLIEKGLNLRKIGRKLGITYQAVHSYITSRGLIEWYKNIQSNKIVKNVLSKPDK